MRREARRKLLLLKQTQPLLFAAAVVATSGLSLIALMVLWSGSSPSLRFEGSVLRGIGAFKKCIVMDESHYDDKYFDANACISVAERSQRITALVKTLTKALDGEDIDYWLDSGTLLGQFRTQSVIPWDTDADIGITTDGYRFLRDSILQFPTSSYELQVYESEVNPGKDRDWNIPVRFVETKRGFYVDVFVFSESTANDVPMLGTTASCSWIKCVKCLQVTEHFKLFLIPRHYVFPLIPCEFADFEVLCPARRTLYLEHIYGVDFRIADPSY
ncbi:hypothetical protein Gpo141_00010176 [Globisporangium polare]